MKLLAKKIIAGAALAGLVLLASGFASTDYKTEKAEIILKPGQTIEMVAEDFYDAECYSCYDSFRYEVLKANHELIADGRCPQVGDKVVINYRVRR